MTRAKNFSKPNGHAGPHGRPNGHAPASSERSGVPPQPGLAASDDPSGLSVANAAADPAAAGTAREAYAEVATLRPNGAAPPPSPASPHAPPDSPQSSETDPVPPGDYPLPDNVAEFVEEVHRKIDLTEVWHRLLRSKDEKIRQRAAERLTDMLYKDAYALEEDGPGMLCDIDSAVARRAAKGGSQ